MWEWTQNDDYDTSKEFSHALMNVSFIDRFSRYLSHTTVWCRKWTNIVKKKMRLELISDEKGKKETPTHDIHSHVNHRSILLLADITLLPAFFHSYSRIHSVNKAFSLLRLPLHTFYAFIRSVGSLNRTHTHTHTLIISINYSILSPWSLFMGFNVLIHI